MRSLLAALLIGVAGVQAVWAQNQDVANDENTKVVFHFSNGESVVYMLSQVDSIAFEEASGEVIDGYECVDLDLPSRTLWATCNVGAETIEGYGSYFAWGETEQKESYGWETYQHCNGKMSELTKYCMRSGFGYQGFTDNKAELEPQDDAASANWSNRWQTPLYEQMAELVDTNYVIVENTVWSAVNGLLITSKSNGRSIFLPAAGRYSNSRLGSAGSLGYYWTRSLNQISTSAYSLHSASSGGVSVSSSARHYGFPVRAVCVQSQPYAFPVTSIKLNDEQLELGRGTTHQLQATVMPSYARNKDVRWESSDESVATVENEGNVTAMGEGTCTITCRATDGGGAMAVCQVTVGRQGITDGHTWVDLGLPSGTLWATCNVGADTPEEYGHYIAWGETQPKEAYDWQNYRYYNIDETSYTKYCTSVSFGSSPDGKTWLQAEDDAATANWGGNWQMPSRQQFEELISSEYTTAVRSYRGDVAGLLVTSLINGESIFLPTCGIYMYDKQYNVNYAGEYWSRSLFTESCDNAYYLGFAWSGPEVGEHYRPYGMSIRPVRYQEVTYVLSIALSETSVCLEPNETTTLVAVVSPADAANTNVTWESDNPWVATVDETGRVTAAASSGTCTITCRAADGSGVYAECLVTVVGAFCPDENHPHTIDLGLPSGTKWCCCNVGASSPTGYGSYYAWGETSEKDNYDPDNYDVNVTTDIAGTSFDAAFLTMGAPWRMPTNQQMTELKESCTYGFWTKDGVGGIVMTSPNGKQIFLPSGGNYWLRWNDGKGKYGEYWTSTPHPSDTSKAWYLRFDPENGLRISGFRNCEGKTIRAVCP